MITLKLKSYYLPVVKQTTQKKENLIRFHGAYITCKVVNL